MDKKEIEKVYKSSNHMTYKSYGLQVKTLVFHRSVEISIFREMSGLHQISFLKISAPCPVLGDTATTPIA